MGILVGTSGWQYDDWRGPFYPPGLPRPQWLAYYFAHFQTVEINATFYRLPSRAVVSRWAAQAPPDAVFTIKASRFLTHVRRLQEPEEPVRRMEDVLAPLGARLGPVLLQLPPTLAAVPGALDRALAAFPSNRRVAVEPRERSWFSSEVRDVLVAHGAALVWADRRNHATGPLWQTADWGFVRFHEGVASPRPSYGTAALTTWFNRVTTTWSASQDVYVYFNNDPGGVAIRNASTFARVAARAGWPVSRTP